MTNQEFAYSLLSTGYDDYIAARVLLNKDYHIQGLTLASSAVEKYLKVILAVNGKTKKEMGVHLDRWDKLESMIKDCYTYISKFLDERFLGVLGKAYQARYYDNLNAPIMISFFKNQLIGELDYTVSFIEKIVTLKGDQGIELKTPYQFAVAGKEPDLFENNYVLNGILKRDFMEMPDEGFGYYIDVQKKYTALEVEGKNVVNVYHGKIAEINLKFA